MSEVPSVIPGVRVFRVYAALAFAFAWVPVMFTAFVGERGFSADEYSRLWATYYAVMVVAELPWGWVADRFGKRPLLLAGPLVLALAFVVLGRAREVSTCLFAMGLTGAAHAMISGADSAWLYDHVRSHGRRAAALAEEAGAHRWRLLGVSVADLAGGLVAFAFGTAAAFDLAAVLMLGAALAAWRLPVVARAPTRPTVLGGSSSARWLSDLRRPGVVWSLAWFAAVFVLLRVGFQLYQPTLIEQGVTDLRAHGAVFGGLNLVAGLAALAVSPVFARLGEGGSAIFVLALLVVSFGGLASAGPGWLLPLLAAQQVSFAFLQPVGRTALNHRIPSGDRAGLLSAQSVAGRLGFAAVLFLADGDLAVTDLPHTYGVLALSALALAIGLAITTPPPAVHDDA